MNSITVRRMKFDIPKDLPTVFIEGEPEESYVNIALSLMLPYLEPYLIRSMRAAKPLVKDPVLLGDLEKFCAQEGQHYRQHMEFNAVMRGRGFEGTVPFEEKLEADYQRFTRTKSLRFNLAYAEGFEAFTTVMARVACDVGMSKWNPKARDLFLWHLVEELEHRTVAFDVYAAVSPGYFYRLVVGTYAQLHFLRFMFAVSDHLIQRDTAAIEALGGAASKRRRERTLRRRLWFKIIPRALKSWLPWYSPRSIDMPEAMSALAARYTREAVGTKGADASE